LKIPKGNPNSKIIEEGQTTQRGQEDRQWSTKDTHKAKDRVTRIPHSQVPFSDFYCYAWLYINAWGRWTL